MKGFKKRTLSLCLSLIFILSFIPQGVLAGDLAPSISIQDATAAPGDTVEMYVQISNNPGILGATLTLSYDAGLTLTSAQAGDAFRSLSMTKPGKFESPCNFVWDGQEISAEDIKDGVI